MEDNIFAFIAQYMELTSEEKQAILDLNVVRSYKKGDVLLSEGRLSREGYFVLKGCLRTYYLIDGEEKTTAFYTEMEGFTPATVLNNQPSEYFVACVEDSILAVSNPDMETAMFERFPRFETLCRIHSETLLAKNQVAMDAFKNSSPEERYLNLIEQRPDLIQRAPQHQLASFLGITPQSLSRLRSRILQKSNS